MSRRLQKNMLVHFAWMAGLVLLVGLLAGGAAVLLAGKRAAVAALSGEVEAKRERLRTYPELAASQARLKTMKELLAESSTVQRNEGRRTRLLLELADVCGAAVDSVQSLDTKVDEKGATASCTHELHCSGDLKQVATLLQKLSEADGVAAIEFVHLQPDRTAPDRLRASVRVTWYAPGPQSTFGKNGAEQTP